MKKMMSWIQKEIYAHFTIYLRYWYYSTKFDIKDSQTTLAFILQHHVSVSRYGDYEYMSINMETNNFQTANRRASNRLREVLNSSLPNHIVCIPYSMKSVKYDTQRARTFWIYYMAKYGKQILSVTDISKTFYDASFTRYYMDAKDKSTVGIYVEQMKMLWENRDVYIVEGEGTHFGSHNDFMDNARSIHRILCPSTNAFDKYDDILSESLRTIPKSALVLCALGMTATILAYDLAKAGYQAIDIGHADIEYSWFKMGTDHKVPVEGKNVNEVGINDVGLAKDEKYLSEIMAQIK